MAPGSGDGSCTRCFETKVELLDAVVRVQKIDLEDQKTTREGVPTVPFAHMSAACLQLIPVFGS